MFRLSLTATIIVCFAGLLFHPCAARAQENAPAPLGYVLEIGRPGFDSCSTSPISSQDKRGGTLFTVPRDPSAPQVEGKREQATAITVRAALIDDDWIIDVGVRSGEFYDGTPKQVAARRARTNERVVIDEVAPFGAAPFAVAVRRVLRASTAAPQLVNKTRSVSVEVQEPINPPSPLELSIQNLSGKDVLALEVNTLKGGRRLTLKWPEVGWLEPLIRPGETYRLEVMSTDSACGTSQGYRPGQADTVEIATVVFADGSYEGDSHLAAITQAQALGYEKEAGRVLEALNSLAARADPTAFEVASQLKELLAAPDETSDPSELSQLRGRFAEPDEQEIVRLGELVAHSMREVKRDLLADVKRLEEKSGETQNARSVRAWIEEMRRKYGHRLTAAHSVTHSR